MADRQPFKIDISKPAEDFQNHLNLDGNQRIIFSAPFGTGKTYFLKKFFKEENPSVFHLYPVNYSVSSNEDIFELIKYDLLYELLDPKRKLDFQKVEYDFSQSVFIKATGDEASKVIKKLITSFSKLGVPTSEILEVVDSLEKLFQKPKGYDELEKIHSELQEATKTKGSIIEWNDTSELIFKLIAQVKETCGKAVLIIDDLDRIDPEHIFRLLNVFAAHFDLKENENKFGFDQVVFVCDIDNIRKIFATKYGQYTDFSGYIDKFYSRDIYSYDNSYVISGIVEKLIYSFKISQEIENHYHFNKNHTYDNLYLIKILTILINKNAINLRGLLKFTQKEYYYDRNAELRTGSLRIFLVQIQLLPIFLFLNKLFGNHHGLISALEKVSDEDIYDERSAIIGSLLMIIDWKNNQFEPRSQYYQYKIGEKSYQYFVGRERNVISGKFEKCFNHKDPLLIDEMPETIMELILLATKELIKLRILK